MDPAKLEQALQDAFDGDLDESRARDLREAMLGSDDALAAYCDQALLETELRRHAANRARIPGSIPAIVRLEELRGKRKRVFVSLAAAAAVLMLLGIVLRLVMIAPGGTSARLAVSPGTILRDAGGAEFNEPILRKDRSVTLVQGVARLELESGVNAVIEGPAVLKLTSGDQLEVSSGHAWFHVPAGARGFRVVSPDLEVIDLGTEFGIDQREDQRPQVHVLKGRVEVRALTGSRQRLEMSAGNAATLAPNGRWTTMPADTRKFRDELPRDLPVVKLDFERVDRGMLDFEGDAIGMERATARLIQPELAALVPGISGQALELSGRGSFVETTWPGISGSAPRTVSLWCRVPDGATFQTAPPLAWWGNPAHGWNRKFKFALVTDGRGRTVLRASFGETILSGVTDLADGEWHHLAVVYRGNLSDGRPDISFFIDGGRENQSNSPATGMPVETDVRSETSGALGIGKYEIPAGGRNPFLNAAIDSFRVFAGALDDNAIRALAEPE